MSTYHKKYNPTPLSEAKNYDTVNSTCMSGQLSQFPDWELSSAFSDGMLNPVLIDFTDSPFNTLNTNDKGD